MVTVLPDSVAPVLRMVAGRLEAMVAELLGHDAAGVVDHVEAVERVGRGGLQRARGAGGGDVLDVGRTEEEVEAAVGVGAAASARC